MIRREMRMTDIPTIVLMGEQMAQESPVYREYTYSPEDTAGIMINAVKQRTDLPRIAWVFEEDEELVGFFVGQISRVPGFDARIARDMALYLTPEARGGGIVIRLLKKLVSDFKQWGREHGAKATHIDISTGITPDRTKRLYETLGGKQTGYLVRF